LPTSSDSIQSDAFLQHAHADALLEAASLTGLPPAFIDLAVVGSRTIVFDVSWKKEEEHNVLYEDPNPGLHFLSRFIIIISNDDIMS